MFFSKFRVRIEHCFGRLKERFPSLKEMRIRMNSNESIEYICKWVTVCCIIHNMALPLGNENIFNVNMNDCDETVENNFYEDMFISHGNISGEEKRQLIYNLCSTR